jgi:oligosaccharide repeat unit polymerase
MSILLILFFGSLFFYGGKRLFQKALNPLSLYTIVWMFLLTFYELKLIRYDTLTLKTWIVVSFAELAVALGCLTVFTARNTFGKEIKLFSVNRKIHFSIFDDGGRTILFFTVLFSLIGILAAIQHWMVLIKEFGSIAMVLIKSAVVYRMRVQGEIKGVIPYIFSFTYVAVFLSALYAGYYNKFKLIMLLPFIAMIIKSLAEVARASMLFGIILFFLAYVIIRYVKRLDINDTTKMNRKKIILSLTIIFSLVVFSAALVKSFRGPLENYKASTRTLKNLENGFLISPSLYLYASAHVGVLNDYFKKDDEITPFGENTFLPFYRILAKFNLVEKPSYYQKGYFIPLWTNTGTYLREIHADFGYVGLFTIPYLLGLFTTLFWFRFFEKFKYSDLVILLFLLVLITFTFLVMVTRLSYWLISLILILFTLLLIDKIVRFRLTNEIRENLANE